jgi:uncharacterized membrane protein
MKSLTSHLHKNSLFRLPSLSVLALAATLTVSCTSGPNARTGTVVGGLGGAALGGIVGHQSGRGLEGAAIGGALGALGGNLIGGSQDQRNYNYGRRYYSDRGHYPRRSYYSRPSYYY